MYKSTIGADFFTQDVEVDGHKVCLQIWDTVGQERFLSLGGAFYKGSDCCVIVFDVTQPDTFGDVPKWCKEFLDRASTRDAGTFPFVLIANKVDREKDRKVSSEKARAWCKSNGGVLYFEVSAKTGLGVQEAFSAVAGLALRRRRPSMYFPVAITGVECCHTFPTR